MRPTPRLFILAGALWLALAAMPGAPRAQEAMPGEMEALRNEGRYPEAIALLTRQIATLQGQGRLETPVGATLLNNLGEMHYKLGRYGEAVPFYERALAIANRQMQGPNPLSAVTLRNLGIVYQLTGRPQDAFNAYSTSIGIFQNIPNAAVQLASTMNNLATLLQDYRRFAEAEQVLGQVLGIYQRSFGPSHLYVATAYNNLGKLYEAGGLADRAEAALTAAVGIMGEIFPRDHPQRVSSLRNLGMLYGNRGDWARAVPIMREAMQILQKQAARSAASREGELSGQGVDTEVRQGTAGWFINASMKLMMADQSQGVALSREIFQAGQWRPSQTAASLSQMAARRLKADGPLAALVRQRQDLVSQWQAVEKRTTDNAIKGGGATAGLRTDIARLGEIDKTIAALDGRLAKEFPEYSDFANPAPLDVPAVQALLREDEALALFIETGGPSWVWVISRKDKNLSMLNMTPQQLAEEVAALRCGVDRSNWADPSEWPTDTPAQVQAKQTQQAIHGRCTQLGKLDASGMPPFDAARAHRLYQAFFGAAESTIAGKHLIVVPSASLMQLPFATLVTAPPEPGADLRGLKWLGTTMPVSVLPSVSGLSALRRVAKPSRAGKPFFGIGNPLLAGSGKSAGDRKLAQEARARQSCAGWALAGAGQEQRSVPPQQQPVPAESRPMPAESRPVPAPALLQPASAFRGALADIATLNAQSPLPETADELCAVAQSLQTPAEDVMLGARATETAIKQIGGSGGLEAYRVLHFATHGLVSGTLPGVAEPSLILTPPDVATERDDGLLTASEIAQMRLDADWVVLSACNTAAGGAEGAEALSGLTRAFFYAGARALLVTHWEIDSIAAVKLTTAAFDAMKRGATVSQAEAMRQSMAALVADTGIGYAKHPAVWAAFALIGDGGRR